MMMTIPGLRPVSRAILLRHKSRVSCDDGLLIMRTYQPPPGWIASPSTMAVPRSRAGRYLLTRSYGSTTSAASGGALNMDALKEVRSRSGAPIVDCKKALNATNNDVATALDWLREHGAARASSKVQGRATNEGLVATALSADGRHGSIVHVSSETDFAGRSDKFVDLATGVAQIALRQALTSANQSSGALLASDALLGMSDGATGRTVQDLLDDAVVAIRENMGVEYAATMRCSDDDDDDADAGTSAVVGYVHNRVGGSGGGGGGGTSSAAGTAAALVLVRSIDPQATAERLQSVGKKLAMHVVAARPQYLSPDDVPPDVIQRERDILMKQEDGTGKAPEIVERIVQGRLRKFYEGVCLLEQPHFVEDKNPKVGPYLAGQGIAVERFEVRFVGS
jgi:elongation factor Ts